MPGLPLAVSAAPRGSSRPPPVTRWVCTSWADGAGTRSHRHPFESCPARRWCRLIQSYRESVPVMGRVAPVVKFAVGVVISPNRGKPRSRHQPAPADHDQQPTGRFGPGSIAQGRYPRPLAPSQAKVTGRLVAGPGCWCACNDGLDRLSGRRSRCLACACCAIAVAAVQLFCCQLRQ